AGEHVLYEGLFCMNMTRGPALVRAVRDLGGVDAVHVVKLTTPMDECFRRIAGRRAVAGVTEPVARANTEGNFTRAQNYAQKMKDAGARKWLVASEDAPELILSILRGEKR